MKRFIKMILSPGLLNLIKNVYNRLRYQVLWLRRRTVSFKYDGEIIRLCVVDPSDYIQKTQAKGQFYEETELRTIRDNFPEGGVFLDIGSNTGQHSVFVAKFCGASKIVVVEPIPEAAAIIRQNIKLNHLDKIFDVSLLGFALGETDGRAGYSSFLDNLGGTILKDTKFGTIQVRRGDAILQGQKIDFIKIDTEGFEMRVLAGLKQTIENNRPRIFVEVDKCNVPSFLVMMGELGYEAAFEKEYQFNYNYIMIPRVEIAHRAV